MYAKNGLLSAALTVLSVNAAPPLQRRALQTSPKPTYNGCTYIVDGLGAFTNGIDLDFTKLQQIPKTLTLSTNTIAAGTAPFARQFQPGNVAVGGGYVALTVPGGQQSNPILSAELQTRAKDILYGRFSFYSNDTQEADIAFLTDDTSLLHLTNEQTSYRSTVTSFGVSAPSDATSAWHEYRMDWVPGKTMFYIDGQLVYQLKQNVPSTPGFYLWNNWSNGNAWAKGPPQSDNTVKIQSIVAYFNRTSVTRDPSSAACIKASNKQRNKQNCQILAASGSPYYDNKGVAYNLQCDSDFQGVDDISSRSTPSFATCLNSCDGVVGCSGVAYQSGVCHLKNLNGSSATTSSSSDVDIAWQPSVYNATSSSSSSSSGSNATVSQ